MLAMGMMNKNQLRYFASFEDWGALVTLYWTATGW